jgi:hypothetical protein
MHAWMDYVRMETQKEMLEIQKSVTEAKTLQCISKLDMAEGGVSVVEDR